jgi:glycosyltransferase involved in cell wall biosynthesis
MFRSKRLLEEKPARSLLYPGDWQCVGSRPDIIVNPVGATKQIEILIVSADEFRLKRAVDASVLCHVPLVPYRGLRVGRPEQPLADGEYVICLRDAQFQTVTEASGIRVSQDVDRWAAYFANMLERRMQRRRPAQLSFHSDMDAPVFSITTTIYNTDPRFLEELAVQVQNQTFHNFEWLLLDNGSEREDTVATVQNIAALDARFRYFRVDRNLHIIGGNRYLLERSRGRFIVPVDSDDLLYADALEIVAERCLREGSADLYFSDEQKVSPFGAPLELVWRPEWSTLYAIATCPAAHLMIYRRELGLLLGVYTEDYARGSHDWDTFLRLVDGGAKIVRIDEVLYGWRMHPESSALTERSKNYLISSQKDVVFHSLQRRGLHHRFTIEHARGSIGYYHLVRSKVNPRAVAVDFVLRPPFACQLSNLRHNLRKIAYPNVRIRILQSGSDGTRRFSNRMRTWAWGVEWVDVEEGNLGQTVSQMPTGVFAKAIIDCSLLIEDSSWLWDGVGTLELDMETGIVTGPIMTFDHNIASIGYFAGLDGFFGTPHPGESLDHAHNAIAYIRRHVTAAYSGFILIRGDVTESSGDLVSVDSDDALYGIEFSLRSKEKGIRTAFTPRMVASRRRPFVMPVGGSDTEFRDSIVSRYGQHIKVDDYYARYLLMTSSDFGKVDFATA